MVAHTGATSTDMSIRTKEILEYLEDVKARGDMFVRIEAYLMLADIMPRMVYDGNVTADSSRAKASASNETADSSRAKASASNATADSSRAKASVSNETAGDQQHQTKNLTIRKVRMLVYIY